MFFVTFLASFLLKFRIENKSWNGCFVIPQARVNLADPNMRGVYSKGHRTESRDDRSNPKTGRTARE